MQRFRGIRNVLDQIKLPMVKSNAQKLLDSEEVKANPMGNLDLLANGVSFESLKLMTVSDENRKACNLGLDLRAMDLMEH